MRKLTILLIISCFCFVSCEKNSYSQSSWFQQGQDKYVILIEDYTSMNEAHRQALIKATKLAKEKGYRYFNVLKSSSIDVVNNQMVAEKTFIDVNIKNGYFSEKDISRRYQVVIRLYKKRPFFTRVIDTCRYGRCLKLKN
ncbi:MAG: hypothetical protein COT84_01020 [Chlamydiae bacterium CG10_big_fil_rev_8_21_14_0_10_35_9]|nr:MAG: hypothetical protein COT84_01020 [Chlamydiae bacterium CG10_big_fil_rev_8_21_14_0_10_35_9]